MKKGINLERYNITLDPKVVEPCKKIMDAKGMKLSSVINNLLKAWLKKSGRPT